MGRSYAFLVLALAVAGLSTTQAAPLYKWVDSQGRVSYQDKPPPEDSGYRVEKKNLGPGGSEGDDALEKIVEQYPVVLYSVPVCGSCDLARIYLEKRKVPFTEKNIENNPELQQEIKKKAGSLSAPIIMVGEKVMNGYLESLLGGELDAAGYPKIGARAAAVAVDEDESQDREKQDASAPDADDRPAQQ